jgi:cell division septation protein DedD
MRSALIPRLRHARIYLALILSLTTSALGQEPNIESYLTRIENGEVDEVRAELPSLLRTNPNNPGVLYLQALLTTDGAEAVRMYQTIVDTYPKSEWADDALWKTYKFYTAIGLHRTAEIKLNQLKSGYPDSKYLAGRGQDAPATAERKIETSPAPQATEPSESPKRVAPSAGDMTKEKTKPVEAPPPPPTTEATPSGAYTLQVGVYSSATNANRQAQFFEYQKFSTRIVSKMKGGRELFYVYVGSFATAAEAQSKGGEIKRAFNIDYFVVTP